MHLLILSQAAFFAWLAASLPLREAMPLNQLSERTLPNRNVDVPVDAPIDLVKRQSDIPLSLSFDVPISIIISSFLYPASTTGYYRPSTIHQGR